jgi:putative membrane protein
MWSLPQFILPAHPGNLLYQPTREVAFSQLDEWFQWDFHESIFLGTVAAVVLYTLGVTYWRKKYNLSPTPVSTRQAVTFYGSMVLMYLSLDGPLHHLADELSFAMHMVQHLLLQMVWAPLFILGLPGWLIKPLVQKDWVKRLGRTLTRPLYASLLFQGCIWIWHFPPVYELALTNHPFHIAEHLLFMATAVIFWWVIFSPIEETPRPTHGWQMMFLLLNLAPMKALGLIITVHNDLLYTFYAVQPRLWGLTPVGDQRAGGLLMWVVGGLPLWAALAYVFWHLRRNAEPEKGLTGVAHLDAEIRARRAEEALG